MNKGKNTKAEWLEANGFSEYGVTYLVLGNSYPIKDTLKNAGFKFSSLLRWHGKENSLTLPEGCFYKELNYEDVFIWNEESGVTFMKEGAREKLESIFTPKVECNSSFIGEIGERIHEVPVLVQNIGGFDSAYGYKWIYTLEDESGNRLTWFTTSQQPVSIGMHIFVSGTIKAHVEYKGILTTQLTRCSFKGI